MEKNGPVRVSYEAKSKNPIDVGTFVFTVSLKLYMEVCIKITQIILKRKYLVLWMLSYLMQSLRNTSIVQDYIPANDVASIMIVNTVHTFDASLAMDAMDTVYVFL